MTLLFYMYSSYFTIQTVFETYFLFIFNDSEYLFKYFNPYGFVS